MLEKKTHLIREGIVILVLAVLIIVLTRFAVQSFRTDGQSMEPNFHGGELVLVNKAVYLFQQPQRGDVIVFHYPLDTRKNFMKRVIGVPGDTVQTTFTTVSVDGHTLREPYISQPINFDTYTWKLGPKQFFVLGDNRGDSLDSRSWGLLEQSYIVGKVAAIYWPVANFSLINTYPSVYTAIQLSRK